MIKKLLEQEQFFRMALFIFVWLAMTMLRLEFLNTMMFPNDLIK
jgi:hypothetical protein